MLYANGLRMELLSLRTAIGMTYVFANMAVNFKIIFGTN
jgi:hypothetical protein